MIQLVSIISLIFDERLHKTTRALIQKYLNLGVPLILIQEATMANPNITVTKPKRPLTWLITGCSSGLGLSLARAAQSNGHTVIATSRQPSRTPELVTEITQNGGEWHTLDVTDSNAAPELLSELESKGHRIDVLVNNAGFAIIGAVEQFSDSELRAQMETVYFGPSRLIRAFVPGMRERRFGVVVNISSGAGLEGRESMGAYAAAKAAMDGMFYACLPFCDIFLLIPNSSSLKACVKSSRKKSPPSMFVC